MITRRVVVPIALAVLALGVAVWPAGATSARIVLRPVSGPPTTKDGVTGRGFGPTEVVLITFDGANVTRSTTDPGGSFSARYGVPASALPGVHLVAATGQTSGLTDAAPFTVQTNWSKFAFDAANTGFNPYENVIDLSDVSRLGTAWTGATGGAIASAPAVVNGVAYIGSEDGNLYAFDAAGGTNCSTPRTCQPLWTGATGAVVGSSPAVAKGVVYVGSTVGKLYAFDAAGVTNCSGTPKTCAPLWTSDDEHIYGSSPSVANGVVYIGGGAQGSKLYAFDAAGVTNCSGTPKTCTPMWTGLATGKSNTYSSPAIADGVVYIASDTNSVGGFDAFDAAGVTNCSGTPKTCAPLWTANTGSAGSASPSVANGIVYVTSVNWTLFAFDAAGVTNCSGTPKTCTALWTSATRNAISTPAVAKGVVYVGSLDGLDAFDAAGLTNCSGASPRRCSPLWTGATGGLPSPRSPAVANGLVYVGSEVANLYAYDAAGVTNCSGSPKTCTPVWAGATGATFVESPVVANGMVFANVGDGNLYAFSLQ